VIFFGDGAAKCTAILEHKTHALFVDNIHPSAKFTGVLAWQKFLSNTFENIAYFEPFYLKEFFFK
jgi:tRNA threonylcarbamoyladenosine biosynthesis protein TsaB